jgi:hypothetical protein
MSYQTTQHNNIQDNDLIYDVKLFMLNKYERNNNNLFRKYACHIFMS